MRTPVDASFQGNPSENGSIQSVRRSSQDLNRKPGICVQVSEGKGVNPQLYRRSPFSLAGPPLGHFMAVANRLGAICFLTLVGSHRSFHWLECQLLLRPEMHPEVCGTSGIYLKGQSSPLWTDSCSSQEFRHSFFIHTTIPPLP